MNKLNEQPRVLFVLQLIGQPRLSKRIGMLREEGCSVEAVAFDRNTHKGRQPDCKLTVLGFVENGRFLSRIPVMLKALLLMRQAATNADVIYCTGPDMSMFVSVACVGRKIRKVVEVGDVHPMQTRKGFVGSVCRYLDKAQMQSSKLLVVTAPDFLNVYYRKWLGCDTPGLVLENKVESHIAISTRKSMSQALETQAQVATVENSKKRIRIGYFGSLRCKWSWKVLMNIADRHRDTHEIVLSGRPLNIEGFTEAVASRENVVYTGEYKSPDDLESLYSNVDLIWACYEPIDPENWNHKWARPNRFYEACLYMKPLISRDGSNDSVVVKAQDIGFPLDTSDEIESADIVAGISATCIERWSRNMRNLDRSVYSYTDEAQELKRAIDGMCD